MWQSQAYTAIDLGDDVFTRGRPHPMIDQDRPRCERLRREAADPEVVVILFDVVLGHGAHPDPAAELVAAIESARAAAGGRAIAFVGSVCGTADPQDPGPPGGGAACGGRDARRQQCAGGSHAARSRRRRELMVRSMPGWFEEELQVLNVGLPAFGEAIRAGGAALDVQWAPPGQGDPEVARRLSADQSRPDRSRQSDGLRRLSLGPAGARGHRHGAGS